MGAIESWRLFFIAIENPYEHSDSVVIKKKKKDNGHEQWFWLVNGNLKVYNTSHSTAYLGMLLEVTP